MEAEKTYQNKVPRTIQQKRGGDGALEFVDNRQGGILQAVAEPVQRLEDEDETLQGKFEQPVQRLGDEEDETLQGKFAQTVQREEDDDEALQGKFEQPVQKKNETGMPDNLKAGIEDLSGFSMDDVRVHYNSDKPATVQALAYTQGTDIHVAPGQEQHLPHEAWHVAQQMAGRVEPTTEVGGLPVNDNMDLEHEADVMGAKALQMNSKFIQIGGKSKVANFNSYINKAERNTIQRIVIKSICNKKEDVNTACDKFEKYLKFKLNKKYEELKDGYLTILRSIRQTGGGDLVWTPLLKKKYCFMSACEDDNVKGIIALRIDSDPDSDYIYIDNVVGIDGGGKFLIDASKQYATEHNKGKVKLTAADDGLVNYYKKYGFISDNGATGHNMTCNVQTPKP
ncbi:MAG: GNAT family N-acetyltransferase [Bacteroidetes bacterium]|uniref:GNAT family N-acetyltransferase n=1 Tax=Candidatus Cryptobacteroides merdavium TaxID=2840769 RepID=A0A9D9EC31_9BACT|nr:GNAT family N-acetyltransferase [Candidatus Cryptobacteroides merdavium]